MTIALLPFWPLRFLDPGFSIQCEISVIWGRFQWIWALDKLKVHHITTSIYLTYWPRKCATLFTPYDDELNFHQIESWCHHRPLLNYSILAADTLRGLDLLTFDSGHTCRVTCSIRLPSLNKSAPIVVRALPRGGLGWTRPLHFFPRGCFWDCVVVERTDKL